MTKDEKVFIESCEKLLRTDKNLTELERRSIQCVIDTIKLCEKCKDDQRCKNCGMHL